MVIVPMCFFVHWFHVLRLPSGGFLFMRSETEIVEIPCVGPSR